MSHSNCPISRYVTRWTLFECNVSEHLPHYCHENIFLVQQQTRVTYLFLVFPFPEDPEDPLPATLYGSSSLDPAPTPTWRLSRITPLRPAVKYNTSIKSNHSSYIYLTWWNLWSEHLHGHDIDAENPDGTVKNIRATTEWYHANTLLLQLPVIMDNYKRAAIIKICVQRIIASLQSVIKSS